MVKYSELGGTVTIVGLRKSHPGQGSAFSSSVRRYLRITCFVGFEVIGTDLGLVPPVGHHTRANREFDGIT